MESGTGIRKPGSRIRLRRQHAEVPLGVKVLAILIVLDGIFGTVGGTLALIGVGAEAHVAGVTGPVAGAVLLGSGLFFVWLGRWLYAGSRIALDFLIGGYVAMLILGLVSEPWESVDPMIVVALALYLTFLGFLFWCRRSLRELERRRDA